MADALAFFSVANLFEIFILFFLIYLDERQKSPNERLVNRHSFELFLFIRLLFIDYFR